MGRWPTRTRRAGRSRGWPTGAATALTALTRRAGRRAGGHGRARAPGPGRCGRGSQRRTGRTRPAPATSPRQTRRQATRRLATTLSPARTTWLPGRGPTRPARGPTRPGRGSGTGRPRSGPGPEAGHPTGTGAGVPGPVPVGCWARPPGGVRVLRSAQGKTLEDRPLARGRLPDVVGAGRGPSSRGLGSRDTASRPCRRTASRCRPRSGSGTTRRPGTGAGCSGRRRRP